MKYKKRFQKKSGEKLFTFLDHDGVPWNNTNAEHAIQRFAKYCRAGRWLLYGAEPAGVPRAGKRVRNLRVQQRQHSQILAFERDDVGRTT